MTHSKNCASNRRIRKDKDVYYTCDCKLKQKLKQADDIIGHNVSGFESVSLSKMKKQECCGGGCGDINCPHCGIKPEVKMEGKCDECESGKVWTSAMQPNGGRMCIKCKRVSYLVMYAFTKMLSQKTLDSQKQKMREELLSKLPKKLETLEEINNGYVVLSKVAKIIKEL